MPQAAAPPRPRVVCKRSEPSGGGTASMPVREKGRRSPGSPPARPFSRPQPAADRRQGAGLFGHSLGVHGADRLAAGGSRIRTCGPTFSRGCSRFGTTGFFRAGPMVRIRFPPAVSQRRTREFGLRPRLPPISVAIVSRQRDCTARRRSPRRQSAAAADLSPT